MVVALAEGASWSGRLHLLYLKARTAPENINRLS
jgi:hypothetical protein